jgi:hypothetical protein
MTTMSSEEAQEAPGPRLEAADVERFTLDRDLETAKEAYLERWWMAW